MSVQPRRIRLKPWLLAQVDSGRYPGLRWISGDQRLFQIPWKHATRHTPASEEENTIFKAWAMETGKYQEGEDEPDPAKWKANLRCALNKSREFELKYDGTKDTPVQAFKVYEVCDKSGIAEVADDEDEMPNMMELSINSEVAEPTSSYFAACSQLNQFGSGTTAMDGLFGAAPVTSDLQAQILDGSRFLGPAGVSDQLADFGAPPPVTMETSSMGCVQNQQPCKYDLLSSVPLTDLDLKFQYRGLMMGSLTVSNQQGCRLYYGHLQPSPQQEDLFGPMGLQQVQVPGLTGIQNHKQKMFTEKILDAMERGLILEILEQDIYAVRLCQCKVFWSGPGVEEAGPPNSLEREERVKVFSLNNFLEGLISFQRGEAPKPPPFELFFCFGEDWPDRKPWEKKLIMIQVVPVVARMLTEIFSGELSWSTDSIHLQISNPDVKDQTVEQFKVIQRLLQEQNIQGPWTPIVP
ncbi:interferon regulatory factor 5 isoform X1 [Nelusetta ayraudi]|uniref:interferon regulatory factor 5 isoform X1 n=2 Tax=Nelusetta ayraudi TaxID=303726 RepID=UPI003F6F04C3